MCHVRENYPLNWTKKERAVRNKNGIRKGEELAEKLARFKRNSLRETRLTISPIPETSLFPSGIRCYCQTIFPFSNESPLYSSLLCSL